MRVLDEAFDRVAALGRGGVGLLRAEGRALLAQAHRSVVWAGVLMLGAGVCILALAGLLVALAAMLTREIGWIGALSSLSAAVLLLGLVACGIARSRLAGSLDRGAVPPEVRLDAARAKKELAGEPAVAVPIKHPPRSGGGQDQIGSGGTRAASGTSSSEDGWQEQVAGFVARNPAAVASGALCLVAIIGPWKTMRLISRGMLLGSVVSKLKDGVQGTDSAGEPSVGSSAADGSANGGSAKGASVAGSPGAGSGSRVSQCSSRQQQPAGSAVRSAGGSAGEVSATRAPSLSTDAHAVRTGGSSERMGIERTGTRIRPDRAYSRQR